MFTDIQTGSCFTTSDTNYHSVHTPFYLEEVERGKPPTIYLTRGSLNRWFAGKERVIFFVGGCYFYIKNKLKSEMSNYKKKNV